MSSTIECVARPVAGKGRIQFYTPPAAILAVPGVTRNDSDWRCDTYTGTAEALIRSGIATAEMFPGQPGRPVAAATYRPAGIEVSSGTCWRTPGYLVIHRNASGTFRAQIAVSLEEQERRERAAEEKRKLDNQRFKEDCKAELAERNRFKPGDRARVFDGRNQGVLVVVDGHGIYEAGRWWWNVRAVRQPLLVGESGGDVDWRCEVSEWHLKPIDYLRVIEGGRYREQAPVTLPPA